MLKNTANSILRSILSLSQGRRSKSVTSGNLSKKCLAAEKQNLVNSKNV